MTVCNIDMWINGVILSSVGSGLLLVSFILKTVTKSIKEEYRYSDRIEMKAKMMEKNEVGNTILPTLTKRNKILDF
jgi:hypothetical protein